MATGADICCMVLAASAITIPNEAHKAWFIVASIEILEDWALLSLAVIQWDLPFDTTMKVLWDSILASKYS